MFYMCVCVLLFFEAVDFLSQVLDSPELDAVKDAVQNLQDIGETRNGGKMLHMM